MNLDRTLTQAVKNGCSLLPEMDRFPNLRERSGKRNTVGGRNLKFLRRGNLEKCDEFWGKGFKTV